MKIIKQWYPVFFSPYFAIALYISNINNVTTVLQAAFSVVFSLVLSIILLLISRRIFSDKEKSALITFVALFYFLWYWYVASFYSYLDNWILLLTWTFLFAWVIGFLVLVKNINIVNFFACMMSLMLVLISVILALSFFVPSSSTFIFERKILMSPSYKPDIYYVIIDQYAGNVDLKERYNYDNKELMDFFQFKGFYCPEDTFSNYGTTISSLVSSLNLNYLDASLTSRNYKSFFKNSVAIASLQDIGYKYVLIGTNFTVTGMNASVADIEYKYTNNYYVSDDVREFTGAFFKMTVLKDLFDRPDDRIRKDQREQIAYQLGSLKDFKSSNRNFPSFVFLHILTPHLPFKYDIKGNFPSIEDMSNKTEKELYFEQLIYTNEIIKMIVNEIGEDSIIVIQSDHGDKAVDTTSQQKHNILNVYYFPDKKYELLHEGITPVNTFRAIFDTYFGSDYQLLSDKIYASVADSEEKYVDITNEVMGR